MSPTFLKFFPFLRWKSQLDKQTVKGDLLAGLTGAALVLPQGVAFATIAGLPPEYGLYASMVPAIIAALFGSSWHLVSGPTTAASIVMFSSLSVIAEPGSAEYISLAITLSFIVGCIQLAMGWARLGSLVNFISHSVIVGFTSGAACLIAAKQAETFFGLDLPETEHLVDTLSYLADHISAFHPMVTLVSVVTLVTGIVSKKIFPHFPAMVVALFVGSLSAVALNGIFGEATTGIHMVGALPRQLPPLSTPEFTISTFKQLAPVALAMTLFTLTEAVAISRAIAIRSGQAIEGNQEFIGQGLSNIVGSFFSAYVATGSFNRSGANYDAGAKTPLAAISAGIMLAVLVMFFAPLTAYLPKAAIAGLLFLIAWRLIDFHHIKKIWKADQAESLVMIVTFLSTIFLELEFAILFGVVLSLMIFLRKTSKPRLLPRLPDPDARNRKFHTSVSAPECPQMKILRIDDSLYFGSVTYVSEILRLYREKYPEQKHLLLLTKGINHVDVAGSELLVTEAEKRREMGGGLYMYKLKDIASKILERGDYMSSIGEENIYSTKVEAISGVFEKLDKSICQKCDKRIFLECQSVPVVKK
ncbi:MAG: SulP family inorganic anion transporter [Arenicella sp.]